MNKTNTKSQNLIATILFQVNNYNVHTVETLSKVLMNMYIYETTNIKFPDCLLHYRKYSHTL